VGPNEKTPMKSYDTGTGKKTGKTPRHVKRAKEKALDTNELCAWGLKIARWILTARDNCN